MWEVRSVLIPGGERSAFKCCFTAFVARTFPGAGGEGQRGEALCSWQTEPGPRGGAAAALLPPAPAFNFPAFFPLGL